MVPTEILVGSILTDIGEDDERPDDQRRQTPRHNEKGKFEASGHITGNFPRVSTGGACCQLDLAPRLSGAGS